MAFELISFSSGGIIQKQAVSEVVKCNEYTARFGLALTPAQAIELVETRTFALRENNRMEFGGGAIDKIIKVFCDSPYLAPQNYAETLHELVEIFYRYKNETLDLISDEDLIKFMKTSFDGVCQGSLDLLASRELEKMARNLRFGRSADYSENFSDELDDDEEEYDE